MLGIGYLAGPTRFGQFARLSQKHQVSWQLQRECREAQAGEEVPLNGTQASQIAARWHLAAVDFLLQTWTQNARMFQSCMCLG